MFKQAAREHLAPNEAELFTPSLFTWNVVTIIFLYILVLYDLSACFISGVHIKLR